MVINIGAVLDRLALDLCCLAGAGDLVRKLLFGPWDDDVIVVPPGGVVTAEMFELKPRGTTALPVPQLRTAAEVAPR